MSVWNVSFSLSQTAPDLQANVAMTHIAFFGHDCADAAIQRRVKAFVDDGLSVTGFMKRRGDAIAPNWDNVDLGKTFDGAYAQRVQSIFSGAKIAAQNADQLKCADVIYARNLDMLATAFLAKRKLNLKTPVIYECLDVHRLMTRPDPVGFMFRRIEGSLLARSKALVVSSPGFLRNYFEPRHKGAYTPALLENRLVAGGAYGARPTKADTPSTTGGPLRIGWIGILRCARSLDLLLDIAARFGDQVELKLHGKPALTEIPDFHEKIKGVPNVAFHGAYKAPEDLANIYSKLDVVWAGDFMEAGFNSVWLLPNRVYEGGYYAVPPIAPTGTETAQWIKDRSSGFTIPEDLQQTLPVLVERLIKDRSEIATYRNSLIDLPNETFVQPAGTLKAIVEKAIS